MGNETTQADAEKMMAGKRRRRRTGRLLASSCNPEYFPARPGIGLTGRYWRPWPRTNPGQVVQREKKGAFKINCCPLVQFYVGGDDKVSGSCLLTQTLCQHPLRPPVVHSEWMLSALLPYYAEEELQMPN